MNDKININLPMAGSSYPLTIEREEEEMVRLAAKRVDMWYNAYRERYPKQSPLQIMTMVAYDFSRQELQERQRNDTAPYTDKIKELTEVLEEHFRKE